MKSQKSFTLLELEIPYFKENYNKNSPSKESWKFLTGFTLIEFFLVITIIGLISSITLVAARNVKDKAKRATGINFAAQVHHALGAEAVGIWDFDDGSGTTAKDASGYGNNGTLYNFQANPWKCASIDTPSGQGCVLEFDGSKDYVEVSNSPSLNPVKITMEAWIYPTAFLRNGNIVGKRTPSDQYFIRLSLTTGQVQGNVFVNGNWRNCTTPVNIAVLLNTWSHIVYTYDGQKGKVYINGQEGCSHSYTGAIAQGTSPLRIGAYTRSSERFRGLIDQVRIYEQALTSAEVETLYTQGTWERGLVANNF